MKTNSTTSEGARRSWKGCWRVLFALSAILFCHTAPLLASEPALENEEDAVITSLVKESLLFHLLINSRTVTNHGTVTLSGNADNLAEKDLGTSLASGILGVRSVINNMIVPAAIASNN